MLIQFHKIQDGQGLPRPASVPASARRAISAYGGRNLSLPAPSAPLKRGKLAQALIDVAFVCAALLLVCAAAASILGSFFILFFVKT